MGLLCGWLLKSDFEFARRLLHLVGQGRCLRHTRRGDAAIQRIAQGTLDELAAMDFHRRKCSEVAAEFLCRKGAGLVKGLAFEQFGGHGGNRDGGLATKALEGGTVDDFLPVFFGKLQPHAQHVAALG